MPDDSELFQVYQADQEFIQSPGLTLELLKATGLNNYTTGTGVKYYGAKLIEYWPEDNFSETINDPTFVYVKNIGITDLPPVVDQIIPAIKVGYTFDAAQNQVDLYLRFGTPGYISVRDTSVGSPTEYNTSELQFDADQFTVAGGDSTVILIDTTGSIETSSAGLQLTNDQVTPGNNRYYGTDGTGTKGWYVHTGTGAIEDLQDAIGNAFVDTDTVDATYDDITGQFTWQIRNQFSLTYNSSGIMLVGDVASPGNNQVYGTDATGVRGWYPALNEETARDTIGIGFTDTDTIDAVYDDALDQFKWNVKKQFSITSDASGIKLSGDSSSPGNTKYYGTNVSGTKGWYDLPTGGYTDEMAQDAIAAALIDSDTVGVFYTDITNTLYFIVRYQDSINSDTDGIHLVGDVDSPPGSYYYGTDSLGAKGWYPLGGGGGYSDEQAQDTIGLISIDSSTINVTYSDATPSLTWSVITQMSITSDASGVKLSGDSGSPGNDKYYGTNGSGVKGWYTLSATTEAIQDTIGTILADTDTINATYDDASGLIYHDVKTQQSITSDASGIKLSGDSATPGNSRYYGTSAAGTKGYHVLPGGSILHGVFNARLSVSSTDPENIDDTVNGNDIYLVPYNGNLIGLQTEILTLSGSLTLAGTSLTTGKPNDIFVYNNAGTLALESVAWTNATTRATALAWSNGVLVKSGDTTRRYVGTVYRDAGGFVYDSSSQREVWNYYNQIEKYIHCKPNDTTHNYTTATWREWNGGMGIGLTNFRFVQGLERNIRIWGYGNAYNTTEPWAAIGIGIDSTSVNSADLRGGFRMQSSAEYNRSIGIGWRTAYLLQISNTGGTTAWYGIGTAGANNIPQSGLTCRFLC